MAKRGNQGWSTKSKVDGKKTGRPPLPPELRRRNRTLKANDAEWALIQDFAKRLKMLPKN